jgi:hypothetical protein
VRGRTLGRGVLLFLLAVAVGGQASALNGTATPKTHRSTHRRRFRNVLYHPLFHPSRESLLRQNEEIDRLELPRIQDEAELEELESSGELVPIRESEALRFDPRLKPNRRYCRPWTRNFLEDLSAAYYERFHSQIQVNSAVRTVRQQKRLRRHNRNAAPYKGDTSSSHLAGVTVDIQRRGMTRKQILWVEQYMLPLRDLGLIEPEEERHQWVFHVMVSDRYDGWRESNLVADQEPDAERPNAEPSASEQVDSEQPGVAPPAGPDPVPLPVSIIMQEPFVPALPQ